MPVMHVAIAELERQRALRVVGKETAEGVVAHLRRALGDANTLTLSFKPELWTCRIDAPQFEA